MGRKTNPPPHPPCAYCIWVFFRVGRVQAGSWGRRHSGGLDVGVRPASGARRSGAEGPRPLQGNPLSTPLPPPPPSPSPSTRTSPRWPPSGATGTERGRGAPAVPPRPANHRRPLLRGHHSCHAPVNRPPPLDLFLLRTGAATPLPRPHRVLCGGPHCRHRQCRRCGPRAGKRKNCVWEITRPAPTAAPAARPSSPTLRHQKLTVDALARILSPLTRLTSVSLFVLCVPRRCKAERRSTSHTAGVGDEGTSAMGPAATTVAAVDGSVSSFLTHFLALQIVSVAAAAPARGAAK